MKKGKVLVYSLAIIYMSAIVFIFVFLGKTTFIKVFHNSTAQTISFNDMVDYYYDNKELLKNLSHELAGYPNGLKIVRKGTVVRSDWKCYERDGYMLLITDLENDISQEQLNNLDDNLIKQSFRRLRPKSIQKQNGNIVILKATTIGLGVGISFSPNNMPHNDFIYEWSTICDDWYFFKQE